jgi:hypothetical protein
MRFQVNILSQKNFFTKDIYNMTTNTSVIFNGSSMYYNSVEVDLGVKFRSHLTVNSYHLTNSEYATRIKKLAAEVFNTAPFYVIYHDSLRDLIICPKYDVQCNGTHGSIARITNFVIKNLKTGESYNFSKELHSPQHQVFLGNLQQFLTVFGDLDSIDSLKLVDPSSQPVCIPLKRSPLTQFGIVDKASVAKCFGALPEKESNRFFEILGYSKAVGLMTAFSSWESWKASGLEIYKSMKDSEVEDFLKYIEEKYIDEFPTLKYILSVIPRNSLNINQCNIHNIFVFLTNTHGFEIDDAKFRRLFADLPLNIKKEIIDNYKNLLFKKEVNWNVEEKEFCDSLTTSEKNLIINTVFKNHPFVVGVINFVNKYNLPGNVIPGKHSQNRQVICNHTMLHIPSVNQTILNFKDSFLRWSLNISQECFSKFIEDAGLTIERYNALRMNFNPTYEEQDHIINALLQIYPFAEFVLNLNSLRANTSMLLQNIFNQNITRSDLNLIWMALNLQEKAEVYNKIKSYVFKQSEGIQILPLDNDQNLLVSLISDEMLPVLVDLISKTKGVKLVINNCVITPCPAQIPCSLPLIPSQAPVQFAGVSQQSSQSHQPYTLL